MARKTKATDFGSTRPIVGGDEPHFPALWAVYEHYDVEQHDEHPPFLVATGAAEGMEPRFRYRPLADEPHLFLEFARLADEHITQEVILGWVEKYGALGLNYGDVTPPSLEYSHATISVPLMYDWEGGPGETLGSFAHEANIAATTLSLYEAVLNEDGESLLRHVVNSGITPAGVTNVLEEAQTIKMRGFLDDTRERRIPVDARQALMAVLTDKALKRVWHTLQHRLSDLTYPLINHELPTTAAIPHFHTGGLMTTTRLGSAWGFRNLLGAMWLQFYWLVTSREDLNRCKECGRINSLSPPIAPDGSKAGRKPRSDKKYCNKSCQQRHDYKVRVKPKREQRGAR